jgi:hypothetical protein
MAIRDLPDSERPDALRTEARRLASSGKYATWLEVAEELATLIHDAKEVHRIFNGNQGFRQEIDELASAAHGVGGGATE